ncbi:hypothetical protein, partial [Ectothiorhodospira variabilis]|uniref:hypothetical protein n=1 Tax=Ectothiorhodospira variabilis TaxID=505694 RepID=UPI001EFAF277
MKIAIQPDYFRFKDGPQSFSNHWIRTLTSNKVLEPKLVDVTSGGLVRQLDDCSAFMWRRMEHEQQISTRAIPAIETRLRIPCFPDAKTNALTLDKIDQYFHLNAAG